MKRFQTSHYNILQHAATHCNTLQHIKGYMDEALSNVDSVQWGSSEQGHTNTHAQEARARGEMGGATAGGPSNIGIFGAKDPNLSAKEPYLRREGVGTNRFTGDDPPQNSGGRRGEGKCGGWEKGGVCGHGGGYDRQGVDEYLMQENAETLAFGMLIVCCSVLQCVAVCCRALLCVAVCCSVLQCVAVCVSDARECRDTCFWYADCVLQCVAVCCSVLQCVAV